MYLDIIGSFRFWNFFTMVDIFLFNAFIASPSKNVLSNGNGNTTSCNNGGTNLHSTVQVY